MNIEQFRKARSTELKRAGEILQKTISGSFNSSPIFTAAQVLLKEAPALKDGVRNDNYWGYEIENLQIPIPDCKHIRPNGVKASHLILNMRLIADFKLWGTLNDPFIDLNYNVIIKGSGKTSQHYVGFHIDKHDMLAHSKEPHPIYHLHYMLNPMNSEHFEYGQSLHLDTPRIMHYPIDFILGLGFLTSNFFPIAFDSLLDDGYFTSLYKTYQNNILKPYSHTLANHWVYEKDKITWGPTEYLCPFLI